MRTPA